MKRKFKLPFIPTVIVMVLFSALLLWFVNPVGILAGFQFVPISLQSPLNADYSADPRQQRINPLQLEIIGDAIVDRQATADVERIIVELSTPVPTITPMPELLTSTPGSVLPTLVPSDTPIPTLAPTGEATSESPTPTLTATMTLTGTLQPTSTFTMTWTPTNTLPAATSRPTNTRVPPTNTSQPPTNTSVPPTNTPIPPTNTPVPPTNTSVPPTAYPPPPTSEPTSSYP